MNDKVLFIDFRDSFSFNLLGLVRKFLKEVELVDFEAVTEQDILSSEVIILGPGPGHISDYSKFLILLQPFIGKRKILGFCLGHQIIAKLIGLECVKMKEPIHGQSKLLENLSKILSLESIFVQFYNSWKVVQADKIPTEYKLVIDLNMIVALIGPNLLSVQFHPESVGTNCPEQVFEKLIFLLYNGCYDHTICRSLRPTNY